MELKCALGQGWIGRSWGGAEGEGRKKKQRVSLYRSVSHSPLVTWSLRVSVTPYKFFFFFFFAFGTFANVIPSLATTDKFTSQTLSLNTGHPILLSDLSLKDLSQATTNS